MHGTKRFCCLAISLLIVASGLATPARASDVIDVFADAEGLFPAPGGGLVAQLEWGVLNLSHDTSVSVVLNAYVVYANGLRQQVFPAEHVNLGPEGGTIKQALVLIPRQAGPGLARFVAEARVGRVERVALGQGLNRSDFDMDTFVVPALP